MAHEFLRQTLRNPAPGQLGGEGVAQRVEIEFAAHGVDPDDASLLHVEADSTVGVAALREDFPVVSDARGLGQTQFGHKPWVKWNQRLASVLGGRRPGDDVRPLMVEPEVAPNELLELPQA